MKWKGRGSADFKKIGNIPCNINELSKKYLSKLFILKEIKVMV